MQIALRFLGKPQMVERMASKPPTEPTEMTPEEYLVYSGQMTEQEAAKRAFLLVRQKRYERADPCPPEIREAGLENDRNRLESWRRQQYSPE